MVPASGFSTRFPGMRPKYLLTTYDKKLMIEKSIEPYLGKYKIHIGILKQHDDQYGIKELFDNLFGDKVNTIILSNPTRGPADTVYQMIQQSIINYDITTSILIKDCDSFFDHSFDESNTIFVDKLSNNPTIRNASNKSYVNINDQMIVSNIIEKKITSDWFCVGGYKINSIFDYCNSFEKIASSTTSELYVSSVIEHMLAHKSIFVAKEVSNWADVGTKDDWYKFNNKKTIFCDIDGTIIENQSSTDKDNNYYSSPKILTSNVELLKNYIKDGSQIIFTTARSPKYTDITKELLNSLGFSDCPLIMDLHHSQRILINDFALTNPYPSATAINLPRNSDTLSSYLKPSGE